MTEDKEIKNVGVSENSNISEFPNEERKNLRVLEAILFAASEPLDEESLVARLPRNANLEGLLNILEASYRNKGINLKKINQKWAFRTAEDLSTLLEKEKKVQRKLSKAATETLAIIAYHQPVTRAEIEEIRSVKFNPGTIDILLELEWICTKGRKKVPGRPILYGTTDLFLDHFNLTNIADLPNLEELKAAGLLDNRIPDDFEKSNSEMAVDVIEKEEDLDKQKTEEYEKIDDILSENLNENE